MPIKRQSYMGIGITCTLTCAINVVNTIYLRTKGYGQSYLHNYW